MGASVTDGNRSRPLGEGRLDESFGNSYVNLIRGLLAVHYPEYNIRVTNMGVSGNTVRDLKERWQQDVFDLKPDWVSIKIGLNDVWRHFDSPLRPERWVGFEEYCETLDHLVIATKKRGLGIVLMTPFFIEPRKDDPMRKMVDKYSAFVKETALKYDCILVDTQRHIDDLTKYIPAAAISWDRVHPDIKGHMAIALAFMNAIQ